MGAGLVLIFWVFIFGILSVLSGGICLLIVWLIVRKKEFFGKRPLMLLSFLSPGIFIGAELMLSLIFGTIVADIHGVDDGFGDYWQAPLNRDYEVCAIDSPHAASIYRRDDKWGPRLGNVCDLWQQGDTMYASCTEYVFESKEAGSTEYRALYAFPEEGCDTLLSNGNKNQLSQALNAHQLHKKDALTAEAYFYKTQQEAHRIERPVRHILSLLIIAGAWIAMILYIRKRN